MTTDLRATEPTTVAWATRPALDAPTAIEARRSVRRFKPEPIPAADLDRVLELAGMAPSAFNVQPWRFVVVTDPDQKARLQAAAFGQPQVGAAAAVVALYSDMADTLASLDEVVHPGLPAERREPTMAMIHGAMAGKTDAEVEAWGAAQSHIALGYLTIAAQSLGYASSVMAGFDPDQVRALLGIPAHAPIPALIALGVADDAGFPRHRHPLARIRREA